MFHLTIVTAEKTIYDGKINMLIVPTVGGEIGILTNHQAIVTKLGPGAIRVQKESGAEETLFTSGGYLEVNDNKATLLADVVENLDAIEVEQAAAARKRAQELLRTSKDDVEREKLEQELQINMVRERMAGMGGKAGKRGGRGQAHGQSEAPESMN